MLAVTQRFNKVRKRENRQKLRWRRTIKAKSEAIQLTEMMRTSLLTYLVTVPH
jgi:hypothetical protein